MGTNPGDEDFALATTTLCQSASRACGGRVVSVLEGGYNLPTLRRCVKLHVRELVSAATEP